MIGACETRAICHRLRRFRSFRNDISHISRCGLQVFHRLRRFNPI